MESPGKLRVGHRRFILASLMILTGQASAQAPTATAWSVPPLHQACTYRLTAQPSGADFIATGIYIGLVDGKYCFLGQSTRNAQIACVNADGNTVESNGYTRSPHSGLFSWPLSVGKEWEFSFTSTAKATGVVFRWTKHVKVVSYGPVVAGGQSYMAFRIEAEDHNLTEGSTSHETLYYAPAIGKSVKYDGGRYLGSFELLSCAAAPDK